MAIILHICRNSQRYGQSNKSNGKIPLIYRVVEQDLVDNVRHMWLNSYIIIYITMAVDVEL